MQQESHAIAKEQHDKAIGQHLPEGFQPASDLQDIPSLPWIKQIRQEYKLNKPAMMRFMAQKKREKLKQQLEIASQYNANFDKLDKHDEGMLCLNIYPQFADF